MFLAIHTTELLHTVTMKPSQKTIYFFHLFCSFENPSSQTFRDCLSFKKGINPGNNTLEVPKVIPVFLI